MIQKVTGENLKYYRELQKEKEKQLEKENKHQKSGGSDYSQEQVALRVGLSTSTVKAIEKGDGNPTLDTLCKLAEAVHVHPSDLVRERK